MKQTFFMLLFFVSLDLFGGQKLIVTVGFHRPPFVIQDSHSGYELELLNQVFRLMGKLPEYTYMDYSRGEKLLELSEVDAIATTSADTISTPALLTEPYIEYENVAISLASRELDITGPADLAKYSMISFPLAVNALGEEYKKAVTKSPYYRVLLDHSKQPELLIRQRVDILIIEKSVFQYFLSQSQWAGQHDLIKVHHIFSKNKFSMAFKDPSLVKAFNHALKMFKRSPEYAALKNRYALVKAEEQ